MRTLLVLIAASGAFACSASAPAASRADRRAELQPAAEDSLPASPPAVDLSGAWATGSVNEPTLPHIVIHPECNYSPRYWVIVQRGDTVRAWSSPESWAKGTRAPAPVRPAIVEGRLSGVNLRMGGDGLLYVLRYDSTSGHLRGTLNGQPFWAVREHIVRPGGCHPVP
jgi:hypothetical protein